MGKKDLTVLPRIQAANSGRLDGCRSGHSEAVPGVEALPGLGCEQCAEGQKVQSVLADI